MQDNVTISYRGASYEIGRAEHFYGIWIAGAPRSQPLEWWPETPAGWSSAWARFIAIEAPGTIVPVGQAAALPIPPPPQATQPAGPATQPGASYGYPATLIGQPDPATATTGQRRPRAKVGAGLLALGVVLGVIGLFPSYVAGASLAQQPPELVPHVIYLAAWSAGAAGVLLGGIRSRLGALLAAGTSIVTFGLFFSDLGTAIAGGAHAAGAGLVLGLLGWLACAAGSGVALWSWPQGHPAPGRPQGRVFGRPQAWALRHVLALVAGLGGLGTAIAFAPSWDSYTLRAADGASSYITAGNAFASINPGLVITGDVFVMIAVVAVAVLAALWRPVREGAVLLVGATIPMVAQAISALVGVGEATPPAQFGISPTQASQIGLTITNGVTPAFWLYCAFVIVLLVTCAWLLLSPRAAALDAPAGWPARPPSHTPPEPAPGQAADTEQPEFPVTTGPADTAPPGRSTAGELGDAPPAEPREADPAHPAEPREADPAHPAEPREAGPADPVEPDDQLPGGFDQVVEERQLGDGQRR